MENAGTRHLFTKQTDPLALWSRIHLFLRKLARDNLEHGPDERRDALTVRLLDEREQVGRLGIWN